LSREIEKLAKYREKSLVKDGVHRMLTLQFIAYLK